MNNTKVFGLIRLITAAAILFAVGWQIEDRVAHNVFRPFEYFAFFTILTSLFAAVVLIGSALSLYKTSAESARWSKLRLSATTAYVIVAVVYNLLLRNDTSVSAQDAAAHYVWPTPPNEIVHVWAPLLVLLDFLLSRFGERLRIVHGWLVLTYPLTWLLLTIVRGNLTGWWPYWFLDPTEPAGVGGVVTYALLISAFFMVVGFGLVFAQRAAAGRQTEPTLEISDN